MTPLETIVIEWLARKGPREWHGVAAHWNWDQGVEPLLWVLEQPDCDKGTALSVFWACDPYDQMDERHPLCSPGREDYQIAPSAVVRSMVDEARATVEALPARAGVQMRLG